MNMTKYLELREARQKYTDAIQLFRSLNKQVASISSRSDPSFSELLGRCRAARDAAAQHRERIRQLIGGKDTSQELVEALEEAFEPYTTALKAFQAGWTQFADGLKKSLEPFRDLQRTVAAIPKIHFEALGQAIAQIGQDFQSSMDKEERELLEVLAKRGWMWVGLQDHYSFVEVRHILKLNEARRRKAIDAFICQTFRKGNYIWLNEISKTWLATPYLKQRKRIFLDALKAHREERYALSIPALLPLIDGLAVRIVGRNPKLTKVHYEKDAAEYYRSIGGEMWSQFAEAVITKVVYKRYHFGARPPSSVNRHAIMHGEVISYPSEANSLKVILLLDTFAQLLARKSTKP